MRILVTGASGFVGSAIVSELIAAGHSVVGLARSQSAAEKITAAGASVHRADINDPAALAEAIAGCDAVIHTAFNHDFSRYKESCEDDRRVIISMGHALTGTGKPLVITSGIGLLRYDHPVTEADPIPVGSDIVPRAASEEAAAVVAAMNVDVYTVRLPPSVHGAGDGGFVPMLITRAREKAQAAWIGEGDNRWPAVHRSDAAALYRLVVEIRPELKTLHAVGEEGIPFRDIETAIGEGIGVLATGLDPEAAAAYFEWFLHFAGMDCTASAAQTRAALRWSPQGPGLLADMRDAGYFG